MGQAQGPWRYDLGDGHGGRPILFAVALPGTLGVDELHREAVAVCAREDCYEKISISD